MFLFITNPLYFMWNRFLKKGTDQEKKTTAEAQPQSKLKDLEKENQVLTKEQMNKIEGGHSAITQFIKDYEWDATLGGNMPQ